MTKVYLVRHAEAEGNLYRRMHGQYDSLITNNGYRQIRALEERFGEIPVDAVYSSDLFRTMTTARAVYVPKGLPLITRPDLREIDLGSWEDRTFAWADRFDHDRMMLFGASSPAFRAPGGESFGDLRERGVKAVREIAAAHPDQTVVLFAHGTIIRHILAGLEDIPLEEVAKMAHSDNTAVNLVEFDGDKATVVFANDNSHLSEEISTLARQHWWRENSTKKDINLWFQPADMEDPAIRAFYTTSRKEAWENLYGPVDQQYLGDAFLEEAVQASRKDPRSVILAMKGRKPVGLVHLDLDRYEAEKKGYIAFLSVIPQERGNELGVQLIGKAVSICRSLGRDWLRLSCSEKNRVALNFYHKYGFRLAGNGPGAYGSLYVLEKPIGYENQGDLLL